MKDLTVILGPTASGKTRIACKLAKEVGGEIISADSKQVYRFMNIGTGKDLKEYKIDETEIPFHLIDIKDPGYKYNIAEYQRDFIEAYEQIKARNNKPILCGGSGLYIETALKGNSYLGIPSDEELWQDLKAKHEDEVQALYEKLPTEIQSNLNALTFQRKIRAIEIAAFLEKNPDWKPVELPEFEYEIIGLDIERDLRRSKISNRLSYRLNHGLIEEVEFLLKDYLTFDDLDYYGLEYKWVGNYLRKRISKKELFDGLETAIHQFAKRQMTWYRRMEKKGYKINWMSVDEDDSVIIDKILKL